MGVGHLITTALVLKRTEPKINLGYLVGGTAGDERCCILVGPIKLEHETKITGGALLQRS